MRRFPIYIVALSLMTMASCSSDEKSQSEKPQFEPFELSVESDECLVNIRYQRISNIEDNPVFADIEAQNYAHSFDGYTVEPMDVATSAQLLLDEYSELGADNMAFAGAACSYSLDQVAHLTRGDEILCYETFVQAYTGGAHSMLSLWYDCFDLSTGRLYDFAYLFEDEWSSAIRERIYNGLVELDLALIIDGAEAVPETKSVLITQGGVTFVYQPYEVAAISDGIVAVTLNDEDIAATGAPLVWVDEE
jgi:hypothetical protein